MIGRLVVLSWYKPQHVRAVSGEERQTRSPGGGTAQQVTPSPALSPVRMLSIKTESSYETGEARRAALAMVSLYRPGGALVVVTPAGATRLAEEGVPIAESTLSAG